MFDADRPIVNSAQDQLGRATFAKYLARCILDHDDRQSLVIGLYGGWGSGKTSIINLTLEELNFAANNMFEQEKPIILNFSAWSYSGQNQLIYSFFRRLSSEMRRAEFFHNDKIIHLLELYISFFTHKPIPKILREKKKTFTQFIKYIFNKDEHYGWESGRDLTLVKAELNKLLALESRKLIIFIDNILRLQDGEINQIFQMVKSIGDFNHTIYILSLDKKPIVNALNRVHHQGGGRYLKKIVQLPFHIPGISMQDLEHILLNWLNKIIITLPKESFDATYWADIYYSTLKFFFTHSRDITHYINTLSFGFYHVQEVVNPVDFFAITALQVFESQVYYGIRDNKDLFTDLAENVYPFDPQKFLEDKGRCDEIINRSKRIPIEIIEQFVMRLFPRLRHIYQPHVQFYHSEALARKNKRICSQDVFDIYFRLTIPSGTISTSEMNAILAIAEDEEGFALALLRLNQDERIVKFLSLLDSRGVYKILPEYIGNVVSALMDSADLFPEGENSLVSFNTPMRIHRIFHQLLGRVEKNTERFTLFKRAITHATKSLYIIVHELTQQSYEHVENEDTHIPVEYRIFSKEQLHVLKTLAVERIALWIEMGRLAEHPQFLPILFAFKEWGDPEICRAYVADITKTDVGLLAFLRGVFKTEIKEAMTANTSTFNPLWANKITTIDHFISPQALLPHARALFEAVSFENLRDEEKLALLIFLNAADPNASKIFPKING